jgi:hypothetical protein
MANIDSSNSAVCSSDKSDIASFTGMGLKLVGGYLSLSNHGWAFRTFTNNNLEYLKIQSAKV